MTIKSMKKPKTRKEFALYRAKLSCEIGRKALDGENVPEGINALNFALFNLMHAIEDIAIALDEN